MSMQLKRSDYQQYKRHQYKLSRKITDICNDYCFAKDRELADLGLVNYQIKTISISYLGISRSRRSIKIPVRKDLRQEANIVTTSTKTVQHSGLMTTNDIVRATTATTIGGAAFGTSIGGPVGAVIGGIVGCIIPSMASSMLKKTR